ncbi:MAG: ABC transporter substrate-binding protein [Spirochaetaceae bacterium]
MNKRKLFCLLITFTMVVGQGLWANGQKESSKTTIKWQVWVTPNLTMELYEGIKQTYELANPDIILEIVESNASGSGTAADFMRNRIAGGDVPDVWSNVGDTEFIDAGHVWALPTDDPIFEKFNYQVPYKDGNVYHLHYNTQLAGAIFYNKTLWKQAGLTDADIPKTYSEFEIVCEKIKAAGLTPVISGGEWVPGAVLGWSLSAELVDNHPELWKEAREGSFSFAGKEGMALITFWDNLVKNDYIIKGNLSVGYSQGEQLFLGGQGVMYPMGSWYSAADAASDKDWDTGYFELPTSDGKTNAIAYKGLLGNRIYAGSEVKEEAWEFYKWFYTDPTINKVLLKADGLFSNHKPSIDYDYSPLQQTMAEHMQSADFSTTVISYYLGAPSPAGLEGAHLGPLLEAIYSQKYESLEALMVGIDDFTNNN